MKVIFAILFAVLVTVSVGTAFVRHHGDPDRPVLYWVTDNNPDRVEQVQRFQHWLSDHRYPPFELRIDNNGADPTKEVIQGVSGVGGDILDLTGSQLPFYNDVGLLDDVTDTASKMSFDPSHTFPAAASQIQINGRQYLFPCNVWGGLYIVNKDAFRRWNIVPPKGGWTLQNFEDLGKQFTRAANPPGKAQKIFFANGITIEVLRRSAGLSMYNETLSRCILNDARNVRLLRLIHDWMYRDHLFPTSAESASVSTVGGFLNSEPALFSQGTFGMLDGGLHMLIELRKFQPPVDYGVVPLPNAGFPNMLVGTRAAGIYAGSKHKELAAYFLAFLASPEYSLDIVEDADALPPDPRFCETDQFLKPPLFPGEWELRQGFAQSVKTIGIPYVNSPFILETVASRIDQDAQEAFMAGLCSAEEAAQRTEDQINSEIQQTLRDRPELRDQYEKSCQIQVRIDELRRSGKSVPLQWIANPFYRRYYLANHWSQGDDQ